MELINGEYNIQYATIAITVDGVFIQLFDEEKDAYDKADELLASSDDEVLVEKYAHVGRSIESDDSRKINRYIKSVENFREGFNDEKCTFATPNQLQKIVCIADEWARNKKTKNHLHIVK